LRVTEDKENQEKRRNKISEEKETQETPTLHSSCGVKCNEMLMDCHVTPMHSAITIR
jgi:hypothetical protein